MLNSTIGCRHVEGFSLDLEKKILGFGDECPDVPAKAVEVLCALAEESGEVVSRSWSI